ncbi:hypothetical protein [Maricaulis sp.]|uniref:hypothetical protein n=1 Tax=Maricaulis sp. TaxID=1486257 RepID=UPI003A92525D
MRRFAIVLAALILSGCFYSERPLITRRAAEFPIANGVYTHTPYLADGTPFDQPMWRGEVRRRGASYHSEVADFPHDNVRLRELAPGIYVAMKPDDDNWVYGLVWIYPDGIITYHQPSCSQLEQAVLDDYDVTQAEGEAGYCQVTDWDRLSGILLSYLEAVGEPRIDGVYRRVTPD